MSTTADERVISSRMIESYFAWAMNAARPAAKYPGQDSLDLPIPNRHASACEGSTPVLLEMIDNAVQQMLLLRRAPMED